MRSPTSVLSHLEDGFGFEILLTFFCEVHLRFCDIYADNAILE